MNQMIDMLWELDEPKLFITREQYAKGLDGWLIEPHGENGVINFVTVRRGPEFHFQSFGHGCNMTMKMIKAFLTKIISEHGYAITRTPHDAERQHRFNKLIGFHEIGRDEYDVIYRIDDITARARSHFSISSMRQ